MRSLGDKLKGLSRPEKAELLDRLIEIETAIEQGELEPLAGEIAAYLIEGPAVYLGDVFDRFGVIFPLTEGATSEEESRCGEFIELYLGVWDRLGIPHDSGYNWMALFLEMIGAVQENKDE